MSLQVEMNTTLPDYEGKQPTQSEIYDVFRIVRGTPENITSCLILVDRSTFYKVMNKDFNQVP